MLLTVKEVAQRLHVNANYVYKLINSGLLPSLKLGSTKVRVEALDLFLKEMEGSDVDLIIERMNDD